MEAIRTVYQTEEFKSFLDALPKQIQDKFRYVLDIIINVYLLPVKFVKHLSGTDLYELRVSVGPNEYRTILFAVDRPNIIEAKQVIFLNGFLKKSTKDYKKQIETAQKILKRLEL